jgi:hypothetical protein
MISTYTVPKPTLDRGLGYEVSDKVTTIAGYELRQQCVHEEHSCKEWQHPPHNHIDSEGKRELAASLANKAGNSALFMRLAVLDYSSKSMSFLSFLVSFH